MSETKREPRHNIRAARASTRNQTAPGRLRSRLVGNMRPGQRSAITKRVTAHVFRHSFATHLIEAGYDIRIGQEPLGHKAIRTTIVYNDVPNKVGRGVPIRADFDDFRSG